MYSEKGACCANVSFILPTAILGIIILSLGVIQLQQVI